MSDRWFSITMRNRMDGTAPPDEVTQCGTDVEDEYDFASALFGALTAMRRIQTVWGNGEDFGGNDLLLMVACLVELVADYESGPGGIWHFDNDPDGKAESANQLAALEALKTAAEAYRKVSEEPIGDT